MPSAADRDELRADCARCAGLCCVALPFAAGADFPEDKAAGDACGHLREDFRCAIHARLRERGFRGCTVFDCFGAGQLVTQETFGGADWRSPGTRGADMFAVFGVVRALQELRFYLAEAAAHADTAALAAEVAAAQRRVADLVHADAERLSGLDTAPLYAEADPLLRRVSERVRAGAPGPRADHRRADWAGASRRGADLRGADLRGALLIAADLRGADLRTADLIGADLRDADLRGADVSTSLFLTQPQLTAARGDGRTRIPAGLERPAHWGAGRATPDRAGASGGRPG